MAETTPAQDAFMAGIVPEDPPVHRADARYAAQWRLVLRALKRKPGEWHRLNTYKGSHAWKALRTVEKYDHLPGCEVIASYAPGEKKERSVLHARYVGEDE
jgi:hypothetical protein